MSTTIDEKVVELRFDNSKFESNVKTSISTLDKLKNSLNLDKAAKGLDSVNIAASKFPSNVLGNAINTVGLKFSALQVAGVTALANITNTAIINETIITFLLNRIETLSGINYLVNFYILYSNLSDIRSSLSLSAFPFSHLLISE